VFPIFDLSVQIFLVNVRLEDAISFAERPKGKEIDNHGDQQHMDQRQLNEICRSLVHSVLEQNYLSKHFFC